MSDNDIAQILSRLDRIEGKIDKFADEQNELERRIDKLDAEGEALKLQITQSEKEQEERCDKELEQIKDIKNSLRPIKEAGSFFGWLQKQKFLIIIILIFLALAVVGFFSVLEKLPANTSLSKYTLGELWTLIFN